MLPNVMEQLNVSKKKSKRLENKKQKMKALIALTQSDHQQHSGEERAKTIKEMEVEDKLAKVKHEPAYFDSRKYTSKEENKEEIKKRRLQESSSMHIGSTKMPKIIDMNSKKHWLPPDSIELAELRQELRARKKALIRIPRLRLNIVGEKAVFSIGDSQTLPLFLSDIQDLLAFFLTKNTFYHPRWCNIEQIGQVNRLVFVIVEGISAYAYASIESQLPTLSASDIKLQLLLPSSYGGDLAEEMAHIPLSPAQKRYLLETHGSVDGVLQNYTHLKYKMLRALFPIKCDSIESIGLPKCDRFPREKLLLDIQQLIEYNYPLPVNEEFKTKYAHYVNTKDEYREVGSHSPLFALDCEMCETAEGSKLTRVSVVDEAMTIVYDTFVKPDLPITNYLTQFSGVTAQLMKDVTTKLVDVQKALRQLLPSDAIIVGQSLNFDLHALEMMHPYVIDTSVIFNITGLRNKKTKLSTLAHEFLGEKIQIGGHGHCSIEDSMTCMKLVKLKLSNSPEFGDAVQVGRNEAAVHLASANAVAAGGPTQGFSNCPQLTQSLAHCTTTLGRSLAVIGSESIVQHYTNSGQKQTDKFKVIKESNAELAVNETVTLLNDYESILLHLETPEDFAQVEQHCNTIWSTLYDSSILVVLLGGAQPAASGLALIRIKKPPISINTSV